MAVKQRSILLACVATGVVLAFGFLIAANTPNLGYMRLYLVFSAHGGSECWGLNSLLHLGGGNLPRLVSGQLCLRRFYGYPQPAAVPYVRPEHLLHGHWNASAVQNACASSCLVLHPRTLRRAGRVGSFCPVVFVLE